MAAATICMYFKVEKEWAHSPDVTIQLEKIIEICLGSLEKKPTSIEMAHHGDVMVVGVGENRKHVVVRLYKRGVITVDLQLYVKTEEEGEGYDISISGKQNIPQGKFFPYFKYIKKLQRDVKDFLGPNCQKSNSLFAPIVRGGNVWPYDITADDRIIERDYDCYLHDSESQYQHIQIAKSVQYGAVLILNDDVMLGESDIIYTNTLIRKGEIDFKDKTVLILGGGDGGLLNELRKQNPKHVKMAEIDLEVIKACRTHMRSVCGSAMDELKGDNYEIVLGDCVELLRNNIENGIQYDYVINDLPEYPVDMATLKKKHIFHFKTTSLATELALQVLKPGGKMLSRGNCSSADYYHDAFEANLKKLDCEFIRRKVYVPSFGEEYYLYEISKLNENGTN